MTAIVFWNYVQEIIWTQNGIGLFTRNVYTWNIVLLKTEIP